MFWIWSAAPRAGSGELSQACSWSEPARAGAEVAGMSAAVTRVAAPSKAAVRLFRDASMLYYSYYSPLVLLLAGPRQ